MGKNNDLGAKLAVAIIAPLAVKFAVERFAESEKGQEIIGDFIGFLIDEFSDGKK